MMTFFEVQNDDAFAAAKLIAKHEGILVGISSGAALHAALELAKKPGKCRKDDRGSAAGQRRPVLFYYPVRGLRKTLSFPKRKYHANRREEEVP